MHDTAPPGDRFDRLSSTEGGIASGGSSILPGLPLSLRSFPTLTHTNRRFASFGLDDWDRFFLPASLAPLADQDPVSELGTILDDNRSAIVPRPVARIDGLPFYLSIKGIGSTVDPYSRRRLDATYAAELTADPDVRARLGTRLPDAEGGVITGEVWLRGSPYGGQGLPHAAAALAVSERADLTNLAGFRIAPVVKIAPLPPPVADRLRTIHWYRTYAGPIVQEIRLVPSNVRVYFHSQSTLGQHASEVFERFAIDTPGRALAFETNFVRSGISTLTLFARTLELAPTAGRCTGLDFFDVWIDKDAVIAPDGTLFFVDLEGIEPVTVEATAVREKLEDQVYHSLYEFMFAYEQIEVERSRRFGASGSRKRHFEAVVAEALREDRFARPRVHPAGLVLEIRPASVEEALSLDFPLVDR